MSETSPSRTITRRGFLRKTARAAGGIALAGPFRHLYARQIEERSTVNADDSPYGALTPVADPTTGLPLLKLPPGFRYRSYGWAGDPMSDGTLTPDAHDGMAVIQGQGDFGQDLVLMRNHERGPSDLTNPLPIVGAGLAPIYDGFQIPDVFPGLGGGTTALTFRRGRFVDARATLGGTLFNCAGGATPWGSWLTCEEIMARGSIVGAKDHGYVFEVPSTALGAASTIPLTDMGFMPHEACAIDPVTGYVYETEDNPAYSGFYRFRPLNSSGVVGSLEDGGTLEMLKVVGTDQADLRTVEQGATFSVEWVEIGNPNADPERLVTPFPGFPALLGEGRSGPYLQGEAQGACRFSRLEGCWYHGDVIYFVDTDGGPQGKGVLWAYQPPADEMSGSGQLSAVFVSQNEESATNPDNVTVSPRGGILLCEGSALTTGGPSEGTRLIGLNPDGTAFPFAENNVLLEEPMPGKPLIAPGDYRKSDFAGATFDPRGRVLFVNVLSPGVTFAIRGHWRRGPL